MAGHRRPAGKPLLRQVKARRRRLQLDTKLAAAAGVRDRVAAAVGYLRGTVGSTPADQAIRSLVGDLIDTADRIHLLVRHAALTAELNAAGSARDQLAIAADDVRAALATAAAKSTGPATEQAAADLADQLVIRVIAAADQLNAQPTGVQ